MDPLLATALVAAFSQVGWILVDKAIEFGGVEPLSGAVKARLRSRRHAREQDSALVAAVESALQEAGVVDDRGALALGWRMRLDKLTYAKHDQLRRLVARHALTYVHPDQVIVDELYDALNWPRAESKALQRFLLTLRQGLSAHDDWHDLLRYVNEMAAMDRLYAIERALSNFDRLIVATDQGEALRVQLLATGLTPDQFEQLEERYREAVDDEYRRHSFRGIAQFRKNLRLPLADIYVALGMTAWYERDENEEEALTGEALAKKRLDALHKREREADILARERRIVLLADPGAGKSMTLEYIALMLSIGQWETTLSFEAAYLPILVPLRDFAAAGTEYRSLYAFLLDYVTAKYGFDDRLKAFVRLAFENGLCMVLLDGLDEVGDAADTGQWTRGQVLNHVQTFADMYCNDRRQNRLLVTSRKEGYRDAMLADVRHVELSALRPPEEIEHFLLRFYTALERNDDPALDIALAQMRASDRVADLLPQIMGEDSVLLLATNPLLLTILVLIYENVGRLPNRRVKLYHICAQTLIASWRQTQTARQSRLLAELDEETVFNVMARLAYWLHAHQPGGTAPLADWQVQLEVALQAEEVAGDLQQVAETFLDFCRFEAGLLSERGLGRFGFFHLTFEEYLAGYAIAHTDDLQEQERMLQPYWENPRWREVILLSAGEVGIVMNSKALTRMFLDTVLALTPADMAQEGRAVILAGRALHDIGAAAVPRKTEKRILHSLQTTMQGTEAGAEVTPGVRHEAGMVLDSLDWLPDDLNQWVLCPQCGDGDSDLYVGRYPVTNVQFAEFMLAGGYENPHYWGGEDSAGWQWRVVDHNTSWRGEGPVVEPEYWQGGRFGRKLNGFPVVGVSWYEAQAYCRWLTNLLERVRSGSETTPDGQYALIASLIDTTVQIVQLPGDSEWVKFAGGEQDNRYPWDILGSVTKADNSAQIVQLANVRESGIERTSAVAMYPNGMSYPYELMDLAGNVWEWTRTFYDDDKDSYRLRGGSFVYHQFNARVANVYWLDPGSSYDDVGFRVCAPSF